MSSMLTVPERRADAVARAEQLIVRHGRDAAHAIIKRNLDISTRDWNRSYWQAALDSIETTSVQGA